MNQGRRKIDPLSGPQQQTAPLKTNRLRRSFRQTQQTQTAAEVDSPKSQKPEFKSPTRIPRSRAGAVFSAESPHNDSDIQQDIIWDATSPSPNRLGKRGKKQPPGLVDISDIVNRIAPKHGRPKVAEPTLQQWIGDTIPCTPDVQVPKHKKKSPRPNAVDDLLKLAKQFDFNMFHQDEEVEDLHQQSAELLSEDVLGLDDGDQNDFSPSLPGSCPPAVKAAAETDVQLHLDQFMEDDLDFLFDGPTQHLSGNLSQVASAQPSQVKPASKEASGKTSASSHAPTSLPTDTKGTKDEFDDDWENDDLLNDSLVLEMTQNPQNFISPKHSSTQKPLSQIQYHKESQANVVQSAVSKVEKGNVRQRASFKLEPNPNFSVKRIQTDTWTTVEVDYSSKAEKHKFSSSNSVLNVAGSQRAWQTSNTVTSDPLKPQFNQRTPVATTTSTASNTSKPAPSFPIKPAVVSSRSEAPAVSDLQEEDLSFFFASDPVWDDLADDDLLCVMCEDVENQIQTASTKQTLPVSNQRASLQPSNRNQQPANQQPLPPKTPASLPCAPGRPAGSSLTAGFVSNVAAGAQTMNSFRYTQAKNTSGFTNSSTCVQSAPQGFNRKDQFTFKKPNNPVSTVTNKGKSMTST